jgi:hypothetical protein
MAYSQNPYTPFLEDNPELAYLGLAGKNKTNPFLDWYRSNYSNVYSGYLGQLGNMALTGSDPTLSWLDYLKQNNPFAGWGLLSPSQRGERTSTRSIWNI